MSELTNDINVYDFDDKLFKKVRKGSFSTVLIEYYSSCNACIVFERYYKILNDINYERYDEKAQNTIIMPINIAVLLNKII